MSRHRKHTHASAGRIGGTVSKRSLDPETARRMVRVREARRLFTKHRLTCFWSSRADLTITAADVAWVAEQLCTYGGMPEWLEAQRLCP